MLSNTQAPNWPLSESQRTALKLFGLHVSPESFYVWRRPEPYTQLEIIAEYVSAGFWRLRNPDYEFIMEILNASDSSSNNRA